MHPVGTLILGGSTLIRLHFNKKCFPVRLFRTGTLINFTEFVNRYA